MCDWHAHRALHIFCCRLERSTAPALESRDTSSSLICRCHFAFGMAPQKKTPKLALATASLFGAAASSSPTPPAKSQPPSAAEEVVADDDDTTKAAAKMQSAVPDRPGATLLQAAESSSASCKRRRLCVKV